MSSSAPGVERWIEDPLITSNTWKVSCVILDKWDISLVPVCLPACCCLCSHFNFLWSALLLCAAPCLNGLNILWEQHSDSLAPESSVYVCLCICLCMCIAHSETAHTRVYPQNAFIVCLKACHWAKRDTFFCRCYCTNRYFCSSSRYEMTADTMTGVTCRVNFYSDHFSQHYKAF